MRLYDISEAYVRLQLRAEDGEDVSAELEQLDGALSAKAEGVVHVLRNLEGDADKIGAEIKRLQARKKAVENNAERILGYLRASMEKANITRIKAPTFTATLSDGSDRVEIDDESKLPDAYVRTTREPNKKAILDNYRATGEILSGVRI